MHSPVYHFHEPRFSTYGHPISENPVKKKVFTLKNTLFIPLQYFENLEIGLVKILSYKLMSFVVSLLNSIIESGS